MRFITSAIAEIIASYDGKLPLAIFIKQYFKAHPKLGSRDRRAISDAVYTFYRLAAFVRDAPQNIWGILQWAIQNDYLQNPIIEQLATQQEAEPIAPDFYQQVYSNELSDGIDIREWQQSMLQIPDTFIRLRVPAFNLIPMLQAEDIPFEQIGEETFAFPPGLNLSQILPEQFYVVQDYSSQQSLKPLFQAIPFDAEDTFYVWDCCSGAGGKTLQLKDKYRKAQMLCTDIRNSSLHNLRDRAKTYYHKYITTRNLDAAQFRQVTALQEPFDVIIADVPCSGSGTWARTPERFYYFQPGEIKQFALKQYKIAANAAQKLKSGGHMLYITCSVFKDENEHVVAQLLATNPNLELLSVSAINGIEQGADCMFTALLRCR